MINFSNYIVPFLVSLIISHALIKKVDIYDEFIEGAKESFDMIFTLFPCILAMIFSINIFIKSGVLNFVFKYVININDKILPILPMIFLRPISGTSTLAILNNIFNNYGPDSFIGRLASVIQGSTDTTLYVISLYFSSIGIKKIRYSLWVGLLADVIGIVSAIVITKYFFG